MYVYIDIYTEGETTFYISFKIRSFLMLHFHESLTLFRKENTYDVQSDPHTIAFEKWSGDMARR